MPAGKAIADVLVIKTPKNPLLLFIDKSHDHNTDGRANAKQTQPESIIERIKLLPAQYHPIRLGTQDIAQWKQEIKQVSHDGPQPGMVERGVGHTTLHIPSALCIQDSGE